MILSSSIPAAELSVDAVIIALKTTFDPDAAEGLSAVYELRLAEEQFRVRVADGQIDLARGSAEHPDAVIDADSATLRRLVFGDRELDETLWSGDVTLTGDREAAERFLRLFPRPEPASVSVNM
jgi:alkyl sulfatase BDS1-like metallo-beta-lactamase superfamily hydrolase